MNKLDFQTWICPICCDDHRSPDKNEIACKHSDLVEMREQIKKLEAEKESYYHDYRVKFDIETKKLSRDVDNLLQERGKLHEQVKYYEQALKFDCGNKCNAEYNPCNAREILKKWGNV
jgi:hypothetical protein